MSCFLLTVAWPDGTGASQMACAYAGAMLDRGHQVVLACGDIPDSARAAGRRMLDAATRRGVAVHFLSELGSPQRPSTPGLVRDLICKVRADAVVGFTQRDQASGMWAARMAGIPGVLCAQNMHNFGGHRLAQRLKSHAFGWLMRRSVSLAVATSERVQQQLVTTFGMSSHKTMVLPNAITVSDAPAVDENERGAVRAEFGVGPDELMLVNVGRIDTQKGQDLLIEALGRQAPQGRPKVVLVGGVSAGANAEPMQRFYSSLRGRLLQLELEDSVVFAGWRDDVPRILGAADGYVHAARWEGPPLPLAAMEAMAASLPIILTDCVGFPLGFEQSRHGFVVPSEDVSALAEAVGRLSAMSPAERRRMGAASRDLIEREYDIRVIGNRFVDVLETLLAGDTGTCA